ncbi:TolC family protein [Peredibacter sp. HCB2-198]|uniref:TolC family protein n=1 Tax=Peredibacter sp. HCB2-198 TaxID=3383025 RepID=UPI0038B52662
MGNYLKLLVLFVLSPLYVFGATVQLSENLIQEVARKGAPQLDQIEAAFQASSVRKGEEKEKYAPELFGQGIYSETNERALIEFSPIFSPVKQVQLGVRQNLAYGFDSRLSLITDQRSSSSSPIIGHIKDATTTTLAFTMQMDLWRNLFGRMTKNKVESLELENKKAAIEKDIQTKAFRLSLRRIYWSLVANQESLDRSEALLKSAQTQAKETELQFKSSVAEADEVARTKAQVASREGTITFLKYQRETYFTQLRNLLPEFSKQDLVLAPYDLNKTIDEVLACTGVIGREKGTPYQFTQYDEAVAMIKEVRSRQAIYNSRYADADVKLFGTVKATGVSLDEVGTQKYRGSYQGSIDDIQDHNRTGYEVGVLFTMPLGSVKEGTQRAKELYDDKRLLASIDATDAQVVNTHQEFMRSIGLLNDVIRSQKLTAQELEKRLKGMRRKYEQARVSVSDMVQDQDAFLNAELATINTQLQILNTIFDYLVVFPETPCEFNRI